MTRQDISEATGFDFGLRFDSEDEVHMYFSTENMAEMYGGNLRADYPELADQDYLDRAAHTVIFTRWHCDF